MKRSQVNSTRRYPTEKELGCEYCVYWQSGSKGYVLGGPRCCPYYVPEEMPVSRQCDGCPYGMASPCIGWCTVDVMSAVFGNRTNKGGRSQWY